MPTVAIVILNWNGRKVLETYLPSVLNTTYEAATIYVADNASTDDSVSWLQTHYPQVTCIAMDKNRGYAGGYNTALKEIEADYFVLLNSDVEVEPNWLQPMVTLMESDPNIAACQPKIKSYVQKSHFEYAGASGGFMDAYGYPLCRGRVFDEVEQDNGQYDDAIPVFWATGACLFIRSGCFKESGGLDPYFFAHQEEIDLCWRLQLEGYKIYVCPQSVVYHLGGGTLPQGSPRKTYLNFRNNLIMLWKNEKANRLLWIFPVRLVLDGVVGLKEMLSGHPANTWAIVKAHFGFYKWFWADQNSSVFPRVKSGIISGRISGLLPWRFYVQKRKKFNELKN